MRGMHDMLDDLPNLPSIVDSNAGLRDLLVNLPATAHDAHHVPRSSGVEISRRMPFTLPLRPTGFQAQGCRRQHSCPSKVEGC